MSKNAMSAIALKETREYKDLLNAITLEFDTYKTTVHLDYQAMSDAFELLGNELLLLKNSYAAHIHGYTDENNGVTTNKLTSAKK